MQKARQNVNRQILLQNSEKLIGRRSHDKEFETLIEIVFLPLCGNMHPHLTYSLLFSFSRWVVYLKVLMLECLHFSPTTGSLYYGGWMTLHLGRCKSVLLISVLVFCKHRLFCNALWLTISCALALFDCACDMNHESVINELLFQYSLIYMCQ